MTLLVAFICSILYAFGIYELPHPCALAIACLIEMIVIGVWSDRKENKGV